RRRRAWLLALGAVALAAVAAALGALRTREALEKGSPQSAAALLAAGHRAVDEGADPQALGMTGLAAPPYPGGPRAHAPQGAARHAWDAEKSLGLWPSQGGPASPAPSPSVDSRPSPR